VCAHIANGALGVVAGGFAGFIQSRAWLVCLLLLVIIVEDHPWLNLMSSYAAVSV